MRITIFTYNRQEMLSNLLEDIGEEHSGIVIDDGSDWVRELDGPLASPRFVTAKGVDLYRFDHEGKKGFWKKWDYAIRTDLESKEDWFLFLPDDITDLNLGAIEDLTNQGWDKTLFACNIINDGRTSCWGYFRTGQDNIKIGDMWYTEVGYVDCGFLTNRFTLQNIRIDPVPESWFDRPDKSSGVGAQLTKKFQKLKVKMMSPIPSLCFHGDHESVMHGEHRKDAPLTSIK